MGGRLFGGADHGYQNVGLERRAWPLAQAVSGSVGSQGTATNVPALRVGTDRSWRPQERSADGEAACARGMRSIASLRRPTMVRPGDTMVHQATTKTNSASVIRRSSVALLEQSLPKPLPGNDDATMAPATLH